MLHSHMVWQLLGKPRFTSFYSFTGIMNYGYKFIIYCEMNILNVYLSCVCANNKLFVFFTFANSQLIMWVIMK